MPRPKKEGISEEVGNIPVTRKRGNPDFKVSSYYIPAGLNLKFDRAVLALKAAGYDIDRSDILAALVSRFVIAVDAAEETGGAGEHSLESILDVAGEGTVSEVAEVSYLKEKLQSMVDQTAKLQKSAQQDRDQDSAMRDEYRQKFDGLEAQMKAQKDLLQKLIDQQG